MTIKTESLLQTPISHTPFPITAPYKCDKLAFANSYIDEILKWQKLCVEELQQLKQRYQSQDKKYELLQSPTKLIDEVLGEKKEKQKCARI